MDYKVDCLSDKLKWMPAKSGNTSQEWLPFYMHSLDTGIAMEYLTNLWITDGLVARLFPELELGHEDVNKLAIFIGLIHDIGKLTALFAAKILKSVDGIKEQLSLEGILITEYNTFLDKDKTYHSTASETILKKYGINHSVASIAGAHHGKPQRSGFYKNETYFQLSNYRENYFSSKYEEYEDKWCEMWKEWVDFSLKQAEYNNIQEVPELNINQAVFLCGLLVAADWIASNTNYFPLIDVDSNCAYDYWNRKEKALRKLSLTSAWNPIEFVMYAEDFQNKFGFSPNVVQSKIVDICNNSTEPGIYILEAPMGIGKTEAALAAAEILATHFGCGGMYFGLPTQATANGLFPRIIEWAQKSGDEYTVSSVKLAHGMAALNEYYQSIFHGTASSVGIDEDNTDSGHGTLIVHKWFEGRKQALFANFVVATVDQLLMMALKKKHFMLRHAGMANKVVIIDECHAYDAYMNQYLDVALSWLGKYKVPVIILSATLPASRRIGLVKAYLDAKPKDIEGSWQESRGYPLITWTKGDQIEQECIKWTTENVIVKIIQMDNSLDALISKLKNTTIEGGCAGIIVNTVKKSQELAMLIEAEFPNKRIILFHSCFIATDRNKKEKELLQLIGKKSTPASRNDLIVIGTQVLEQSLDIDFDVLFTDLCPMELLLQRMGRLHRHHNRLRPNSLMEARCYILGCDGEIDSGSRAIYKDWLLLRTLKYLTAEISLPKDIPDLVQDVYLGLDNYNLDEYELNEEEVNAYKKYRNELKKKKNKANSFILKHKPKFMDGLLDNEDPNDYEAEATVRDTGLSISVLVLRKINDKVAFLPWNNNDVEMELSRCPDAEIAREIATQKLNLPYGLCNPQIFNSTLSALEVETKKYFMAWQDSAWLKGELFLLLDNQLEAMIGDFKVKYSHENGLTYEREVEADE